MAYDTISVIIFFIAGAMILLKIISFVMKTMVTIQNYKESILESSQRKKQRKEANDLPVSDHVKAVSGENTDKVKEKEIHMTAKKKNRKPELSLNEKILSDI